MSELRGVLFDLGGTLLEYVPVGETWREVEGRGIAALYHLLAEHGHRLEAEAFYRLLIERIFEAWEQAIAGQASPTLATVIEGACLEQGVALADGLLGRAVDAYCASAASVVQPYPGAAEVLALLKASGLKVGLISNTLFTGELHRRDLERFGLLPYFDDLVFSSECGRWKPSLQVFTLALERLGLEPQAAIFVGDRLVDDVGGAQAAGLKAVLRELDRPDTDYERGRQLGLQPHGRVRHLAELPAVLERLAASAAEVAG
ncbi:MAG: HAD family hydrolase [Chloroflexi bacterium]|nr:HAD family hydrolase [Chloroflexota bacterium]